MANLNIDVNIDNLISSETAKVLESTYRKMIEELAERFEQDGEPWKLRLWQRNESEIELATEKPHSIWGLSLTKKEDSIGIIVESRSPRISIERIFFPKVGNYATIILNLAISDKVVSFIGRIMIPLNAVLMAG